MQKEKEQLAELLASLETIKLWLSNEEYDKLEKLLLIEFLTHNNKKYADNLTTLINSMSNKNV